MVCCWIVIKKCWRSEVVDKEKLMGFFINLMIKFVIWRGGILFSLWFFRIFKIINLLRSFFRRDWLSGMGINGSWKNGLMIYWNVFCIRGGKVIERKLIIRIGSCVYWGIRIISSVVCWFVVVVNRINFFISNICRNCGSWVVIS